MKIIFKDHKPISDLLGLAKSNQTLKWCEYDKKYERESEKQFKKFARTACITE